MPVVEQTLLRLLSALRLRSPLKRMLAATPAAALLHKREVRRRPRLVSESELSQVYGDAVRLLESEGKPLGDYLEFGVYNGTSLMTMQKVLQAAGNQRSRLIGFDSFEGLPAIAATDCDGHWRPGQYSCSLEFTRRVLEQEGVDWERVILIKGYFDATLTAALRDERSIRQASLIMVDCDLYQSAREALAFCTPLIKDRAVLFFDDWYPLADRGMGEKAAFDEWLVANPLFAAQELWNFKPYGKTFLVRSAGSTSQTVARDGSW